MVDVDVDVDAVVIIVARASVFDVSFCDELEPVVVTVPHLCSHVTLTAIADTSSTASPCSCQSDCNLTRASTWLAFFPPSGFQ